MIFISYRIADSNVLVSRLDDSLAEEFGRDRVFRDRSALQGGQEWPTELEQNARSCEIMLVVIGGRWKSAAFEDGPREGFPRLSDPQDWVRREITAALDADRLVVPVIADGGAMPAEAWLANVGLERLFARQGVTLRTDDYTTDVAKLIALLRQLCPGSVPANASVALGKGLPAGWLRNYLSDRVDQLSALPLPFPDAHDRQLLPIDAVYVPMHLRIGERTSENARTSWTMLLDRERAAITADAGGGKSTLLRYIALQAAKFRLARLESPDGAAATPPGADGNRVQVPLLVDLATFIERSRQRRAGQSQGTVEEFQLKQWVELFADELALDESTVHDFFRQGDILFLFDGLDEVPDAQERVAILSGVAKLQRQSGSVRGSNSAIVTCREAAWGTGEPYSSFEKCQIQRMDRPKTDEYLKTWCHAVWAAEAVTVQATVFASLLASPAVREMAANPQIAAMLAMVRHDSPLPRQRAVLYEHFINRLIKVRDKDRREEIRGHLNALAAAMQTSKDDDGTPLSAMKFEAATNLLGQRVHRAGSQPVTPRTLQKDGEELLCDLEILTGLLQVDRPQGLSRHARYVRFRHRTFQEFLAARQFVDFSELDRLLEHVVDPAWSKTLAFAAGVLAAEYGESGVSRFLEQVLQTPRVFAERKPMPEELAQWAPRVAAASVCLVELAAYDNLDPRTLDPARKAHTLILPLLADPTTRADLRTRVLIAEGFGSILDPRLEPGGVEQWVVVPAGAFTRGSNTPEAWVQERPQAGVAVSEFWIRRWPVTVAEFRRFAEEERGYQNDEWWSEEGRRWRDDEHIGAPQAWDQIRAAGNRPVTGVSWWEADAFCRWYTAVCPEMPAGWVIQLPTEAQWEKAARGGRAAGNGGAPPDRRFPWGDDWKHDPREEDRANCRSTALGKVVPVGLFPAGHSRQYEVWDMAGNICERCRDGYGPYSDETAADPFCADYRHGHIVRGGAFDSPPLNLRVSHRFGAPRESRDERTGFRCVAGPE